MVTQRTPFSPVGLAVAASLAPALAVLAFVPVVQISGLLRGQEIPDWRELGLLPVMMIFATLYGLVPAALFGAVGTAVARGLLDRDPVWPWALAGMTTAGCYVLISLGLGQVAPPVANTIAPWLSAIPRSAERPVMFLDPSPINVSLAIVLAGAVAGLIYRGLLGPKQKAVLAHGRAIDARLDEEG